MKTTAFCADAKLGDLAATSKGWFSAADQRHLLERLQEFTDLSAVLSCYTTGLGDLDYI